MVSFSKLKPYARQAMWIGHVVVTAFMVWSMHSTTRLVGERVEHDLSQYLVQSNCTCGTSATEVLDRFPFAVGVIVFTAYHVLNTFLFTFLKSMYPRGLGLLCVLQVTLFTAVMAASPHLFRPLPLPIVTLILVAVGCFSAARERHRVLQGEKERQRAIQEAHTMKLNLKADSMLNHVLKNNMADASGCIDLFFRKADDRVLRQAQDILFRGMWWCKWRQAMLSIV
eukprot:CAMPEP_0174330762 /NCGR_PEP_ID=MMETSP0810-20121108/16927_1 /TAXON_ID=73025 ORGANISM="Eutreptiella gymnastica-like, Strain CCMP1594" /NCGR_SAMPLE_ID=MMETSP0810 /ASSEMBLY_ACC=CAM_ASM_000659 /LENGTH=225 /DNA_ID=CAMNT_0015446105 /DNA_START=42 /DNA_END=716 /DNA_ORIENTATION=+